MVSLGQISIADLKSHIADLRKSRIASFDENLQIVISAETVHYAWVSLLSFCTSIEKAGAFPFHMSVH
jgi:hypothetical protein